ncbi:hypothetical protein JOF42_001599 [Microbacterium phyllosphaerae]|uniref:Uncharacterized protein n=1 Tax=Microbacterium phyllosphaerae TaxID=124798 RepID=A0ABS4WPI5_9MICO|nr:hypothetical protein [Microbacterium phyllosphaerae]
MAASWGARASWVREGDGPIMEGRIVRVLIPYG